MIYRLADLQKATSWNHRGLQAWADSGAIQPMPGTKGRGTGAHRAFDKRELIIACVLASLSRQGVTGLYLTAAAALFRATVEDQNDWRVVEYAVRQEGSNLLLANFNAAAHMGSMLLLSSLLHPDKFLFEVFDRKKRGLINAATTVVDLNSATFNVLPMWMASDM